MSNHRHILNPDDFELHQGFLPFGVLFRFGLVIKQSLLEKGSLSRFLSLIFKL